MRLKQKNLPEFTKCVCFWSKKTRLFFKNSKGGKFSLDLLKNDTISQKSVFFPPKSSFLASLIPKKVPGER